MAKIMLAASIIMASPTSPNGSWPGTAANSVERSLVAFEFTGDYARYYCAMLVCNCVIPQLLWFGRIRRNSWQPVAHLADRRRRRCGSSAS